MRRHDSIKSSDELRHNKIHRKLKRAKRLNEPFDTLLSELNVLDDKLYEEVEGWVRRVYEPR